MTACVQEIYTVSDRDGDVQRGKEALMGYMPWRSGEQTLRAHEHVVHEHVAASCPPPPDSVPGLC